MSPYTAADGCSNCAIRGGLLTLSRSVWISLSSSVILFNKWILDTLNFRKISPLAQTKSIQNQAKMGEE